MYVQSSRTALSIIGLGGIRLSEFSNFADSVYGCQTFKKFQIKSDQTALYGTVRPGSNFFVA